MPKLMKCKSCGNMIAKSASFCPQCGGKVQRTSGCAILFLIVLVGAIFTSCLRCMYQDAHLASSLPENIQKAPNKQPENSVPAKTENQTPPPTEQEPSPVKEDETQPAQSAEQEPPPAKEDEYKAEEVVTLETLIAKNREKVYSEMPFQEPKIGSVMIIRVDNEDTEGILHKITDKGILFGSDDVKVMFTWDRLSKKDLIKLRRSDYEEFAKEIATEWAQGELAKIEAEKLKKAEEAEIKRQEAEAKRQEAEAKRQKRYNASRFRQEFIASWDGSCRPVVNAVKSVMDDPDSFEHVKTEWWTLKGTTDQYLIHMTCRGNNKFGAKILTKIEAVCRVDGSIVSLKYL